MKRQRKCIFAPKNGFISHFFPKDSFTPILTAMVFLMVWEVLNMKITTTKLSKNFKGGETTTKMPQNAKNWFFPIFFFESDIDGKCVFLCVGICWTRQTLKKNVNIFKRWRNKTTTKNTPKKLFFPQFFHQGLFNPIFYGLGSVEHKKRKIKFKKYFLARKCIFRRRFATP